MSGKNSEEFLYAKQLHNEGKHKEALGIIESVYSEEGELSEGHLNYPLLESKIRISLEQYRKANALIDKLLLHSSGRGDLELKLPALILKAEIYWRTGKLTEGLDIVVEASDIISIIERKHPDEIQIELKRKKQELFRNAGILNWYKGELDTSLEFHQKSLEINEELGNKKGISSSLNNLGLICMSKGEIEPAIEYYQQSLQITEEMKNDQQVGVLLNNLGNAYSLKGDLNLGLEYFQLSLEIRKELGKKHELALTLNNIGVTYHMKGNLQKALEYYQQSLQISEELGDLTNIALTTNNIGEIHLIRGDLKDARDYLQKSLSVSQKTDNKQNIAMVYGSLGNVYRKAGEYEKAKESYKQGLDLYEQMENDLFASIAHFSLLCVALDLEDLEEASNQLLKIQHINEHLENKMVDQYYRIAQALVLKISKRAVDKMKAQEILEKVINEEVIAHELTTMAMFHLCKLLLSEYKMTEEVGVLEEIKIISQKLECIAKQQSSHSLLVKTQILQSKIALLDMDLNQAKGLLLEAKFLAREKGLYNLERKVMSEEELIKGQIDKWESVIEKNISREELIGLLGLEDLLQRMVHKSVAVLTEEELRRTRELVIQPKYVLLQRDLIDRTDTAERSMSRIGIAQIGLSHTENIIQDFYFEKETGLFSLREDMISSVEEKVRNMVESAAAKKIDLLIFPELTIDLGYEKLLEKILNISRIYNMWIVPGSYHDLISRQNTCKVISPNGILWEQQKQIPAIIHYKGKRIVEGISTKQQTGKVLVANTEFGRLVIVICRDFLDMDLRVELKNHEPPIDILINIAFTPVTEDFQAAHFDARRSIYAYCFFANVAEFGNSLIFSPEKSRSELLIPPGKEGLIYQDINLFELRAERRNWEKVQIKFIQSTR